MSDPESLYRLAGRVSAALTKLYELSEKEEKGGEYKVREEFRAKPLKAGEKPGLSFSMEDLEDEEVLEELKEYAEWRARNDEVRVTRFKYPAIAISWSGFGIACGPTSFSIEYYVVLKPEEKGAKVTAVMWDDEAGFMINELGFLEVEDEEKAAKELLNLIVKHVLPLTENPELVEKAFKEAG